MLVWKLKERGDEQMKAEEKTVVDILKRIGIPPHLKGYAYIKTAVLEAVENESVLYYITKELYPVVAEKYKTTVSRVERAIRHAIEVAFDNMPPEMIEDIFGNCISFNKGKATNSQFLATMVELFKTEENE